MKCPACRAPLLTVEVDGVEIDYCAIDSGVWLDEGEIEALFHSSTPVLKTGDGRRGKRRCPRCERKMRKQHAAPDLGLDVCPFGDGVWFDRDELGRLHAALSSSPHDD